MKYRKAGFFFSCLAVIAFMMFLPGNCGYAFPSDGYLIRIAFINRNGVIADPESVSLLPRTGAQSVVYPEKNDLGIYSVVIPRDAGTSVACVLRFGESGEPVTLSEIRLGEQGTDIMIREVEAIPDSDICLRFPSYPKINFAGRVNQVEWNKMRYIGKVFDRTADPFLKSADGDEIHIFRTPSSASEFPGILDYVQETRDVGYTASGKTLFSRHTVTKIVQKKSLPEEAGSVPK